VVAEALRPAHFFARGGTRLEWDHVAAGEVAWEVFRGRLLDPAHTRERRTFEAWNVYALAEGGRSAEPLLAVKFDAAAGQLHVVRAVHCYAWEGYHAGDDVYLSRETRKWLPELVGSIDPEELADADELADELVCRLFQGVLGTSRLPLTSLEAPLPAFSFGELAYCHRPDLPPVGAAGGPMTSYRDLITHGLTAPLTWREKAKLLEAVLRAAPADEVPAAITLFVARAEAAGLAAGRIPALMRTLFNEVSLSPYTDFADKALAFLRGLMSRGLIGTAAFADFLGHLLRQAGRHLTAYDLVLFHHRGANYPDALLLDTVLREYLALIEQRPDLFLDAAEDDEPGRTRKRLRRRALRQAWLLRRQYEGHAVPDAPTSPGENARVLPAPHVRVPEEQILQPARRTKRLFVDGGPLPEAATAVLRQSARDLAHPEELRELGLALYLDRPLGALKAPGEPDQTVLLSYEAFSRTIAARRLGLLNEGPALLSPEEREAYPQALRDLPVRGLPLAAVPDVPRPGVVSLADARKVADDFLFLRTTAGSARAFFALYDFEPVRRRFGRTLPADVLILGKPAGEGGGEIVLTVCEAEGGLPRLELTASPRDGYFVRAGVEHPRAGLRLRRAWEEVGLGGVLREHDLRGEGLLVR
jgi:hypothetical protein